VDDIIKGKPIEYYTYREFYICMNYVGIDDEIVCFCYIWWKLSLI